MGRESLAYRLQLWLTSPTIANYSAVGFMRLGFAITTLPTVHQNALPLVAALSS